MKKHNITPDNIRDYMNNYESDFPLVIFVPLPRYIFGG